MVCAGYFKDAVVENQTMFFFDNSMQALCKLDIDLGRMEVILEYNGDQPFDAIWMLLLNDKFYFMGNDSLSILIFDRDKMSFVLVKNDEEIACKQTYAVWCEKDIWFVPQYVTGRLCKFDMDNTKFVYTTNRLEEEFSTVADSSEIGIVFPSVNSGCLYASFGGNRIIKYNLEKDILEDILFEKDLCAVCYSQHKLWYTRSNQGNVFRVKDGKTDEICTGEEKSFSFLKEFENYIVALPRHGNNIVFIEKETLKCEIYKLTGVDNLDTASRILNCAENEDYYFFFSNASNFVWRIDKRTNELEEQKVECDDALKYLIKLSNKHNYSYLERTSRDIEDYISMIENNVDAKNGGRDMLCGNRIYSSFKNE